jgi:DNA-binding transcriptional MerR regulator
MPETFHIGELSARTGRSIHAIRWYEEQGLIPGVARDSGGRRVYGELHLSWLDLMDGLLRTGMSIAEMRAYTALVRQGRITLKQRQDMLSAHRARVKETIAEWTLALKLLDGKIDFCRAWITTGKRPRIDVPGSIAVPKRMRPLRRARRVARRYAGFDTWNGRALSHEPTESASPAV